MGRPKGSKNKPGHKAGGQRSHCGRISKEQQVLLQSQVGRRLVRAPKKVLNRILNANHVRHETPPVTPQDSATVAETGSNLNEPEQQPRCLIDTVLPGK
jgi:hypothetical protein